MLLLPLIKLFSKHSNSNQLIGKFILGLLLSSLLFIIIEKMESQLLNKYKCNNTFLNQLDLVNKELFGDLLNNPLLIVCFILILNILLISFVWYGVQSNKHKLLYKKECEMINNDSKNSLCPLTRLSKMFKKKVNLKEVVII